MRDVDQHDLAAPATLFLRMALKEGPGTWRPAWVEVRSDGHLSIFCAGAGGGTTSPVPHAGPSSSLFLHLSAHIERLLEFMPVLDEHCKAVCLRLLPATTLYLASSADPHAGAHAGPSEGVLHRLLACLSSHERLYGEVNEGMRTYFNQSLGSILLYKYARKQFRDLKETAAGKDKPLVELYGAEHLLRLFVKLPELLAQCKMQREHMQVLVSKLMELLKFIQANKAKYFVTQYESATDEYLAWWGNE